MPALTTLQVAIQQLEFARGYMLSLIADIDNADWFQMPSPLQTSAAGQAAQLVSHIAWQVGHLAMAEYGLCLFRQRGRAEVDSTLMTSSFRKQFSRGSAPNPDPLQNPSPAEIRSVMTRVHEQTLKELPTFTDAQLAEPVDMPYAVEATRLGALLFCSHHEMIHAGQIGILRRLLGKSPIR